MNQYPHPGRGDISVDSDPQGATIYVDGYALVDEKGNVVTTPAMIIGATDGIHEIQISMDRYYSKKIFVDTIPGKVNKAFAQLIPMS